MKTEKYEMIAKTFQGLEDVLAEEITGLGGDNVEIGRRMVSFTGDQELLYKANLCCHTALRILKPIFTFTAASPDEVYEKIKEFNWDKYLTANKTFAIDSVVFSDEFRHSKFVTYRAKDAIVDYFNEKYGERPSVRINNADLMLNLHIAHHTCTLSLDSSGESLHKRGYRIDQTEAPLNEVLAAGMLLKAGFKGQTGLLDPMCGSGTLLIEAALIARNIAPGIYRKDFAFEKWNDYDEELFDRLYNDDSNEKPFEFQLLGSDISPKAISIAEENIKSAGLSKYISLKVMPLQKYESAPENCMLITNPPYGERLSSKDLLGLYEIIGERLKHVFKGYSAWIISYREECFDKIGLKPAVKFDLMNGSLECEFRKYEIFDGKYKDFKRESGGFEAKTEDSASTPFAKRSYSGKTEYEKTPRYNKEERTPRFSKDEKPAGERFGKPGFNRDDRQGTDRFGKPGFKRDDRQGTDRFGKPGFKRDDRQGSDRFDKPGFKRDDRQGPDRSGKPGFKRDDRQGSDRFGKPGFNRDDRQGSDRSGKPGFNRDDRQGSDRFGKPGFNRDDRQGSDRFGKPDFKKREFQGEKKEWKERDGEKKRSYSDKFGSSESRSRDFQDSRDRRPSYGIPSKDDPTPRWKKIRDANIELQKEKEDKHKRERFFGSRPPVSERFKSHKKKTDNDTEE